MRKGISSTQAPHSMPAPYHLLKAILPAYPRRIANPTLEARMCQIIPIVSPRYIARLKTNINSEPDVLQRILK
jgi:hypothetical protein